MTYKGRFVITHDRAAGPSVDMSTFTYTFRDVALQTTGGAADIATLSGLPPRYLIRDIVVVAKSATGTLVASVIDIRTAAAGGGASIIDTTSTNATLTNLTAEDKLKSLVPLTYTDIQKTRKLFLRQTTNSANAGVVDIHVRVQLLGA